MDKVIQNFRTTISYIMEHEAVLKSEDGISPIDVVRKLAEYTQCLESQNPHTQIPKDDTTNVVVENSVYTTQENDEINKVKRKVPRWHNNRYRICSQILQAYFDCKRQTDHITKHQFCVKNKGIQNFCSNFTQMCNIAPRNHAKVFHVQDDGEVVLWQPVAAYIEKIWHQT